MGILIRPPDAMVGDTPLSEVAHVRVPVGVPQPVLHSPVPKPEARLGLWEVVWAVRHAVHPTPHHGVRLPERDALPFNLHGLQA